jgi:hypothetical protein
MALAGYSYDDIATEVGYANRGTAWHVVVEALRRETVEGIEQYREVELARLDALQAAHWRSATSGSDTKAAELCLRVMAQRMKLLGMEGAVPDTGAARRTIVISSEPGEYSKQLRAIAEQG